MHEISHNMHLEVNTVSFFPARWQKRPQQTGNCVFKGEDGECRFSMDTPGHRVPLRSTFYLPVDVDSWNTM